MIIWVILVLLILLSALVLTLRSMSNYVETADVLKQNYGVFLIQSFVTEGVALIDQIYQLVKQNREVVCLERLYKGKNKQALIIFAPILLVDKLPKDLSFLELEDYSSLIDKDSAVVWEIGIPEDPKRIFNLSHQLISNTLILEEDEQLWFQLVMMPKGGSLIESIYTLLQRLVGRGIVTRIKPQGVANTYEAEDETRKKEKFYTSFKVLLSCKNNQRREQLKKSLAALYSTTGFKILPSALSPDQKIKLYQKRGLPINLLLNQTLTSKQVATLFLA